MCTMSAVLEEAREGIRTSGAGVSNGYYISEVGVGD